MIIPLPLLNSHGSIEFSAYFTRLDVEIELFSRSAGSYDDGIRAVCSVFKGSVRGSAQCGVFALGSSAGSPFASLALEDLLPEIMLGSNGVMWKNVS